jgi:hypothetical protein
MMSVDFVRRIPVVLSVLGVAFFAGCSSVGDAVMDGVTRGASQAAEERVANAVYETLAPASQLPSASTTAWNQFMVAQAQIVFAYGFSPTGVWPGQGEYEPGEWIQYRVTGEGQDQDEAVTLERALLNRDAEDREWWRLSWAQGDENWIYEALVSPAEGQILRLRARDAEGNIGELPVNERTVYNSPTQLTEESIDGATVGEEVLETPAGSFDTRHVVYQSTGGQGNIEWWLTDQVPGGIVKYSVSDDSGESAWICELIDTGTNATTKLDSF